MSDPIDDLRAVLNDIAPSPRFERGVRERVAAGERAWRPWTWIAAGAIAATAAAVVIALQPGSPVLAPAPLTAPIASAPTTPVDGVSAVAPAETPARLHAIAASKPARVETVDWHIPDSAQRDQNIAVRQLVMRARVGLLSTPSNDLGVMAAPLDISPLPAARPVVENAELKSETGLPLIEIKPIAIAPLVPLTTGGSSGGEK